MGIAPVVFEAVHVEQMFRQTGLKILVMRVGTGKLHVMNGVYPQEGDAGTRPSDGRQQVRLPVMGMNDIRPPVHQ